MAPARSPSPLLRWLLVGFGFLALAISFSARATLGLVMPLMMQEFGWSRSFISGAAAATLLVMAVTAPFAGHAADRYGVRSTLTCGLLLVGIGCLLVALTDSPVVFLLGFSGIAAIGFGCVATHVVSTAIARLFETRRGLATGIATSGATGGQFLIVPLIAVLLAALSWRWSFLAIGIACLVLAPLLWWSLSGKGAPAAPARHEETHTLSTDLRFVLRQPAFHILFWSFLICGYTTAGVIETHLIPYAAFCGFGPILSATAYGLLSAVNLAGMVAAGWLTDRVNRVALLGSIYIVRGLSFLLLMRVGADYETLVAFAVLFGAVDYATIPVTASLAASHLGLRVMGLSMGLISAGHSVGAAAGAFLGGYLVDLSAAYDGVWLSAVALALMAGALVFAMREQPRAQAVPA